MKKFNYLIVCAFLICSTNCMTTLGLWEEDGLGHAKYKASISDHPDSLDYFEIPETIQNERPKYIYSGTRFWLNPTFSVPVPLVVLIDAPLCFVLDTVLLPITIPMTANYYAKLPKHWKWGRIKREINVKNNLKAKQLIDSGIGSIDYALISAVENRNLEITRYLIATGNKVNSDFDLGIAIRENQYTEKDINNLSELKFDLVKILVENGADPSKKHGLIFYKTALIESTYENNFEITKFLIKHGADVNVGDYETAPIHWASFHNNMEMVKLLVEKGADVNRFNRQHQTAIYNAIDNGNIEMIKYLLQFGADLDVKDRDELTPVDYAKKKNQLYLVSILTKSD